MALLRRLAAVVGPAAVASALYTNGSVVAPCDSPIYCYGDLLREVELARPFSDSKTFVDMPALKPLADIQAAFDRLPKPLRNDSALRDFLTANFGDAGGELVDVPRDQLPIDPAFLADVRDPVVSEFTRKVMDIWPDLTRSYAPPDTGCPDCPNSFIPVRRSFVVAGGRFREPYYWDSFWILEGLLRTRGAFTTIARNIIDNFLDFVDQFGFVPNGARIYYLDRSQPPMLAQMVRVYMEHTNDTAILDRALPLLEREYAFWATNRSVQVTRDGVSYTLNRYAVANTQPRPESFREDYDTATNASYTSTDGRQLPQPPLDDAQRATLYADLATAAESGWDFTSRWLARPADSIRDDAFPLRSLNSHKVVPVCLNSILYANELAMAAFYDMASNASAAAAWRERAACRSEAMHAVMWNSTLFSYFDYNLTSAAHDAYVPADAASTDLDNRTAPAGQQVFFHAAQFFPFWTGAAPDELKNSPAAVERVYERVARYLDLRPGAIAATNLRTGQQWDQPNVWPPLVYALVQGLRNTPTQDDADPASQHVRHLALTLAQRYVDSTFCTWYATGGSTSQTPKLQGLSDSDVGIMFEKYNDNSTNVAGGGGEYEVVEGFGWTNGVLIWAVDTFGKTLKRPDCGDIKTANLQPANRRRSALELDAADARRTKRFGRRAALQPSPRSRGPPPIRGSTQAGD